MPEIDVRPLQLAIVELPDFHPEAPGSDAVHAFLVRVGADCVLVDTGVGSGNALIDRLYSPRRVELEAALAEAGASLGDVTAVVNSHLHFDHCGNNALFPEVAIYVQRAEFEAARASGYTVREWVDVSGARYELVDGRHSISEHLELVATPGHTPGHQSLVIRCGSRLEVVAAQAAYTGAEFQTFVTRAGDAPAAASDPALQAFVQSNATWSADAYLASLAALAELRPQRAYFSHDSDAWEPS